MNIDSCCEKYLYNIKIENKTKANIFCRLCNKPYKCKFPQRSHGWFSARKRKLKMIFVVNEILFGEIPKCVDDGVL